jgi:tripartite-type tricarboxylate transporter receptor subunit TctC
VVVSNELPVKTLGELIAYAKANPGKINFGSAAAGMRLAVELFSDRAGIKMEHIGYRGGAPAAMALSANEVQLLFDTAITSAPLMEAGKIRGLATTGGKRAPSLPNLPTVEEAGLPGFQIGFWLGLLAPAGTPRPIVELLAKAVASYAETAEAKADFQRLAYLPVAAGPAAFGSLIAREIKFWTEVAKKAGIEPQ